MTSRASITGSLFAPPMIVAGRAGEPHSDGNLVLRSAQPLGDYPVTVMHSLRKWAKADPEHPLVAERGLDGRWRTRSYGEAAAAGEAIGQALLDRGLGPDRPLVFRGRIAEDFKLETGTFVRVGALRTALLSAAPILADAVLAGENRECVCALAWLNAAETRRLIGEEPQPDGELIINGSVHRVLAQVLSGLAEAAGSSARVERLLVLARPADLDAGEITDKGYVNQRKVLARRATLVEMLYTTPTPAGVIVAGRTA